MKKTILISIFLTTALLQFALVPLFAQKSVELKYNLNEGDVYSYVIDTDQDIVFEANGQTMALDQLMTFDMTQKVYNVTGDSIKLDGQIKRIQSTQGIFGMEVKYDSDDPSTTQNPMVAKMGEEFAKVLNKSYFITMDKKGNMGSMDLRGITDNDDIANNLNSGSQYAIYPEGKVSVGESWDKEIVPSEESDMMFTLTYTLLKVTGKEATLGLNGKISANKFNEADLKMDGTMTGEMIVDVKTGWLIKSTMDQEIEMEVEQNGMKFPATISGTTITTSEKQ